MRLLRGNIDSQAPLIAAEWSAAVLLLLTYNGMSVWSLVPAMALLLLMRQSYALFLEIRETYRTTVEVLVEAAESQDDRRVGHADRTAVVARSIAVRIGLSASEVERISFAALLHDLGELADQSAATHSDSVHASSAAVVGGVQFFSRVEPVLAICDGAGESASSDEDLLAAMIVALASDIDADDHPQVAEAHARRSLEGVLPRVTPQMKARAVGAALQLGYRVPGGGLMIEALALMFGVTAGLAAGGDMRGLARVRLRHELFLIAVFLVQAVARGRLVGVSASSWGRPVWVCASIVLIGLLLTNARVPGVRVVVLGVLLNLVVVVANQGMPVMHGPASVAAAVGRSAGFYGIVGVGTIGAWVGDVIPISLAGGRYLLTSG